MIKYINFSVLFFFMIKVDSFIKLYTLISLNNGKRHGYELMKELEAKQNRKISAAHVYPFLKELRKNKYVEYKKNGREKVYKLTKSGGKFVNNTLLKFNELIKESLKTSITKCTHCGCEVYNNKYNENIKGKKLAFCCCHCANSYKNGD